MALVAREVLRPARTSGKPRDVRHTVVADRRCALRYQNQPSPNCERGQCGVIDRQSAPHEAQAAVAGSVRLPEVMNLEVHPGSGPGTG